MKREILIVLSLILIVGYMSFIIAETNDSNNVVNNINNINSSMRNTGAWELRCQAVNNRVEGRIMQYNENNGTKRFSQFVNLLNNFISRADSRGLNTTVLKTDLSTLNDKINIFQGDYGIFIQKLENTRNFTCGHSEGQFVAALNDSKNQLKIVRLDAEDIKSFFKTTIKNDLQNIRTQRVNAVAARRQQLQNRTTGRNGTIRRPIQGNVIKNKAIKRAVK